MNGRVVEEIFENRQLTIYIPLSYSRSNIKLPVLYVQDGKKLFYRDANVLEELESYFEAGKSREVIIVGIESNNRIDEYTPWKAKALDSKFKDFGGKGKEYLDFILRDLKPYIEEKYDTSTSYEDCGILGASLGGLISLYAAYSYPKQFGKIGAISPSLWYEGFLEFMKEKKLATENRKMYLDVGSKEGIGKSSVQKYMVQNIKIAYDILNAKGFTEASLKFLIEEEAVHNEDMFRKRFAYAVSWLYKKY
ncbi:alpha/beta hydrolase-fold protein [Clostridium sp. C8-1-8]|uniref:alpha/beta hydrolase n=1 Tax=Clostridium sp. C8-1-8 TaxID=2698831 RepID=UPI00136B5639|nr:alpha/beta hydrolase-fold protein [Clostridium sp. C8-1-8]